MKDVTRRAGLTLAVLGISLTGATLVSTNDSARSAVANALADPLSVLAGRSPGARGAGALTQTKPSRVAPPAAANPPIVPTEKALGGGRQPEPIGPIAEVPPAGDVLGPEILPDAVPQDSPTVPGGFFAQPSFPGGIPPIFGGGGTIAPPGGSTGGTVVPPDDETVIPPTGSTGGTVVPPTGSTGGTVVPPTGSTGGEVVPPTGSTGGTVVPPTGSTGGTEPPVSPVPEPASWAMMITGFMGIAIALRRRSRRESKAASDAIGQV